MSRRLPFQRRLTRTCRVRASILANPVVGWILRTRGGGSRASVTASDGKTEKDVSFTKLDELFTQTQLYSEFLLEKMEDITKNGTEGETQKAEPEKKGGRGRKRNAATQMKAKKVVAAMLYSIDCRMKI
ncbi:hypothetical protein Bca4012_098576 [Brassica carinata]|uniref:Uncharacterized protein n=1 Tax=Brassica carinata TaxID=52824 RepID=A0A8X7TRC9_BRACI|nr:hypothetical protein Bca52824_081250 [Brassica carinata]